MLPKRGENVIQLIDEFSELSQADTSPNDNFLDSSHVEDEPEDDADESSYRH